jgi:hypothetical protein
VGREEGKPVSTEPIELPDTIHSARVINSSPGVKNLEIQVNGVKFQVAGLKDNEERDVDISSAIVGGDSNIAFITALGKPGTLATVVFEESND